jgi:large subunit ribosomal protein L29
MKAAELRKKSEKELQTQILDLKKESFNLRMQKATGEEKQSSRSRKIRRSIARCKTILREKRSNQNA